MARWREGGERSLFVGQSGRNVLVDASRASPMFTLYGTNQVCQGYMLCYRRGMVGFIYGDTLWAFQG
jgi:hypothetical protein